MRKYIVLILFVILSCQPEELMVVEPMPQYEMIFEETISNVIDGQEYSFEVSSTEPHHLIISKLNGSVVTKESIIPTIGYQHKNNLHQVTCLKKNYIYLLLVLILKSKKQLLL